VMLMRRLPRRRAGKLVSCDKEPSDAKYLEVFVYIKYPFVPAKSPPLTPDPVKKKQKFAEKPISLVEIGPRFVLELIRIFDGSFRGSTLYENKQYMTANNIRRTIKGKSAIKHQKRQGAKMNRDAKLMSSGIAVDPLDNVFKQ
jgi:hypothetical protein